MVNIILNPLNFLSLFYYIIKMILFGVLKKSSFFNYFLFLK